MNSNYSVAELKSEIETGPLATAMAPFWADVFPVEPEPPESAPQEAKDRWSRIQHRFGKLTPDAVYNLLSIFSAQTQSSPQPITVAVFTQFLASRGLLRKIKAAATAAGPIGDICDLIVTISNSAPGNHVDPSDQGVIAMVDAVVAAGIATSEDKTEFLAACSQPCSRLFVLGWAVTERDLHAAKELS